ncbi:hypothetical protein D6V33_02885 [Vibrio cholerae]|nr:hypothetical protein [Vibrio cholerae]
MSLFMSLIGMAVLLGIAVLLSSNRKAINLRNCGWRFCYPIFTGCIYSVCALGPRATSWLFGCRIECY